MHTCRNFFMPVFHVALHPGDNLYVVMNLIDGTTLGRAILVMREKGEHFDNDRLARIIAQVGYVSDYDVFAELLRKP